MNGGADLGGVQGYGPVVDDANEGNYHADWEPRVMGMVVALGACGQWNIDQSRYARESMSPAEYVTSPYYKIWMEGVSKLLLERGMITSEELVDGKLRTGAIEHKGPLKADDVWSGLHSLSGAADRPAIGTAKFAVGDDVKTINHHPYTHTRLPRYARGKSGVITQVLGHHVFPDKSALGEESAEWLYQVRFSAQELWGRDKHPRDSVTLDLWEPHFVNS